MTVAPLRTELASQPYQPRQLCRAGISPAFRGVGAQLETAYPRACEGRQRSEPDLQPEVLFEEHYVVVTGARSPWVRRRRIKLVELINERWILQPANNNEGTAQISEIFHTSGLKVPSASVHSASIQLYEALVASGRFLAMLPMSVLRFGGKRASIKVLPVELPQVPRPVGIATVKGRTLSPVVQLFLDCARETTKPYENAMNKSTRRLRLFRENALP
jgi:DNA-binding transcriptional LysR family regulator